MKIVVDKYVPYIAEVLAPYAEVLPLDPAEITATAVRDADALIIRTRTRCDSALLEGSKVQFIATATIGFDHIDTAYCQAHDIVWTNCTGCNAQAVCDYVETAILNQLSIINYPLSIGIIGCGHVGSKVAAMAERRGWRVLISDPPREERGEIVGTSLSQIAQEADIITFHTPLTHDGKHPTFHLADATFFAQCKSDALIINAARGGVIDESALLHFLQQHPQAHAVIDCWEGEPQVNLQLVEQATIATFHIAGYSKEGKYNASRMCVEALLNHFHWKEKGTILDALSHCDWQSQTPQVGFNIQATSQALKAQPEQFEQLRKEYPLR